MPSQGVGQIHALCLLLIAAGIISLVVTDRSRIGTDKMSSKVVAVKCPNVKRAKDGYAYCYPGYMVDDLWEGFNLSRE